MSPFLFYFGRYSLAREETTLSKRRTPCQFACFDRCNFQVLCPTMVYIPNCGVHVLRSIFVIGSGEIFVSTTSLFTFKVATRELLSHFEKKKGTQIGMLPAKKSQISYYSQNMSNKLRTHS
jgi:hypothetical protein